ncbi:MAG: VWA domain-containing protein [Nitrospirae bacterium]|nr:VWA domain-containing protein [Nitrospirota bacterium]
MPLKMPISSALRYLYSHKFKTALYVFVTAVLCYSFAVGQQQDVPSIEIINATITHDSNGVGDPSPKVHISAAVTGNKGNTIEGLKKDTFTIHIGEKRIFDFSFKQTSEDPLSLIVAVDVSGSMSGVPIVETKRIIAQFMGYLKESDYVALVTFGTDVKKAIGFTKDKDIIYPKVDELRATENKTLLFKAVTESLAIAATAPTSKSAILLITDAKDEHSHINENIIITSTKESHIPIYTIALGKQKYAGFLKQISDVSGGQAFVAPKYDDIVRLGKAAASGLKARYMFEFPFSGTDGKHTATVKLNYRGIDVTAKKDFTNDIPKDAAQPKDTPPPSAAPQPSYQQREIIVQRTTANTTPIYILLALSAISVILLGHLVRTRKKPAPHDEQHTAEIKLLHNEVTATAGMLSQLDSEIKASKEQTIENTAALSSDIKAVDSQIATFSQQMEDTTNAVKTCVTDMEHNLAEASQTLYEQEFSALKAEISALKDGMIEKNSENTATITTEIKAVNEQLSSVSQQMEDTVQAITTGITDMKLHLAETSQTLYEQEFSALKAEISALKDGMIEKNSENTAAITTEVKAVCEQISTLSQQIEGAVAAMKHAISDMEHNLKVASEARYEQEFSALKAELTSLKENLSAIIAKQIEHSEHRSIESAKNLDNALAINERQYKDNVSAIEKIDSRLNETYAAITNLDNEIKKYAASEPETNTALSREIKAIGERISNMPSHIDSAVETMKTGMADLKAAITEVEKTHNLSLSHTFKDIEKKINEIETSITSLHTGISKGADADTALKGEIKAIEEKISHVSLQMEDAVYAVKGSISGMEKGIKEASLAMYEQEIGAMRVEVAAVKDGLTEVMRFLLILSE